MLTGTPSTSELDKDGAPTLSIDWDLYEQYLEESDLSDEDKREFIETLWSIVVSFVDLGFGIGPESEIEEFLPSEALDEAAHNNNKEGGSP